MDNKDKYIKRLEATNLKLIGWIGRLTNEQYFSHDLQNGERSYVTLKVIDNQNAAS
jgi:hypothetical protein